MISGLGEVTRAKEFIFTAKRQLSERGQAFDQDVEVGCMLETPAAVAICDLLATEVDFFSVGTNDLVQYLLAVDRVNNRIAFLYEPHHPAVIRSLKSICQVTSEKKKPVTVCGEIAGDPHFLPLLLGLGLNSFSASVPLLPELKFFARRFTMEEAQRLTRKAERLSRPSEVKELLKNFYEEKMAEVGK
jgi:phosphotransferase system enzyme I (PtsI)